MSRTVDVAVIRLPHGADIELPSYETADAAGMDLRAAVTNDLVIAPGERALVPTGLAIALPQGYEAQVRPRSGLALRNGISLVNTPGTIDADYRGEVGVIKVATRPFVVMVPPAVLISGVGGALGPLPALVPPPAGAAHGV